MLDNRFDALVRSFDARSRRQLFAALTGVAATLGPFAIGGAAKKHQGHKHKKRNAGPACPSPPPPPPPLTCQQACASNCSFCVSRLDGSKLCADGVNTNCSVPCTSDQRCIGTPPGGGPYCLNGIVDLTTGQPGSFCAGVATPGGFCTTLLPCA